MRILAPALRWLVRLMNVLAGISAILMTLLVFLATVMRYFMGAPLMFSDELVGLLFVCMAFLAVPMALLQRRHIAVDLVVRHMRGRLRRVIDIVAVLIFIAFAVIFIYNAFDFANFSREIGSRSDIGSLVLWPWMMVMPAAFAVATLIALLQLLDAVRILLGREPIFEENRDPDVHAAEIHP